jgi:DNA repair exonuclease SbcCD ATPase subunit
MSLRIEAENFRSFPKIDWELPEGLTLIDGFNKDTGGSNACGKSSLLDCWFWCRYGWLPRWKGPKGGQSDAVIRRKYNQPAGATRVKITERFGPDEISIERQRPNRLTVWKNGIEQKGMDQKGLEILLGMSAERFLVCVYMPQRRTRSFYWMSDNERMDLMSIVVGLEELDRAAEKAKELKKEAEEKIESFKTKIEIYETQLHDLPAQLAKADLNRKEAEKKHSLAKEKAFRMEMRLDEFIFDSKKKSEEEVHEAIDPLIEQIADVGFQIQVLQGEIDLQQKKIDPVPKKDQNTVLAEATVQDLKKRLSDALQLKNRIERLKWDYQNAKNLAHSSAQGSCSQCKQLLPEEAREEETLKYESLADSILETIGRLGEVPDIFALEKEQEEAVQRLYLAKSAAEAPPHQMKLELDQLRLKMEQKKSEERSLKKDAQALKDSILRKYKDQQMVLQHEVEKAYTELSHLERALHSNCEVYNQLEIQFSKLDGELKKAQSGLNLTKLDLNESLDLVDIFGSKGYRAVCFDGLIERISDRAGQLLGIMTDSVYSTHLEQLSQDSKGNQKLILKPIMVKNGSEVPLDDLSGGMEERAALAYDIAIAEAAGEGLPLLLDEVLGGLDVVGKTEAMALLEEVSKTRPVLVIDHSSEFKAMFSKVIRVVYEAEESRLETA